MPSERIKRMMKSADETTAEMMAEIERSGELRHLYGKPLELDDDPEWLINRVLKQQGYSHPLLERAQDLAEPQREAEDVARQLRRAHTRLSRPEASPTPEAVRQFNESRLELLDRYREKLQALNKAILAYNLALPTALHRRAVPVEEAVAQLAEEVLPATWQPPETVASGIWPFRKRRRPQ